MGGVHIAPILNSNYEIKDDMKKQPDFNKLFYDYFGKKPKKASYSIRYHPNRYHDLIFFKSLIHDARFKRSDIKIRGKKLTILVNRDCWELGFVEHEKSNELYVANSRITISPISNVEWRFRDTDQIADESELWINDVIMWEPFETETIKIVLVGDSWSLHMNASDDEFKMVVYDLEVPQLYSQQNN